MSYFKKKTVQTEELVKSIENLFLDDPTISLRKATQLVPASYSTVRSVVRRRLNLKPYKYKRTFRIQKTDREKRLEFARWVLNSRIDYKKFFICSDEAYFYLSGGHNIQNNRIWAQFQPDYILEKPLHDLKVLVWCGFSGTNMYGPYFFDSTVKWDNYLEMLKKYFWPRFSKNKNRDRFYFQQDGAPPHRKKEVQEWLESKFNDRFLKSSQWPPRSPDLNPCDFSLWGGLKSSVYSPKPETLEELKQNITREVEKF